MKLNENNMQQNRKKHLLSITCLIWLYAVIDNDKNLWFAMNVKTYLGKVLYEQIKQ